MSVKFKRINSKSEAISAVKDKLNDHLSKGERVFWLLPGGSGLDIAVAVAKRLDSQPGLDRLSVSLTDERYGKPGHPDSNWQQLIDKGFKLKGARLSPVLDGSDLATNAQHYADTLNKEISWADYSIALAGMGPDGHIFGIKPNSQSVSSPEDVVGYDWSDYQRLTPTINLIKKLDEVIIYTVGKEKHQQIDNLSKDISPSEQPAQLLKDLNNVTIYNDYRGEEK